MRTKFSVYLDRLTAMRTSNGSFQVYQTAKKDHNRNKPDIHPSIILKVIVENHKPPNAPSKNKDCNRYCSYPFCNFSHFITLPSNLHFIYFPSLFFTKRAKNIFKISGTIYGTTQAINAAKNPAAPVWCI